MYKAGFDVMLYVQDIDRDPLRSTGTCSASAPRGSGATRPGSTLPEPPPDGCYGMLRAGPVEGCRSTRLDEEIRSGGLVIHLEVDDVDAYHARLAGAGHEASPPQDMPWGWRMTFFRDPDGHLFGLYQDRSPPPTA